MAKDKKVKKGREEETGEVVVSQQVSKESTPDSEVSTKATKKGKKGKKEDVISVTEEIEENVAGNTKKSKKQKSASINSVDPDEDDVKEEAKEKRSKKSKNAIDDTISKSKKKKSADLDSIELPETDDYIPKQTKKSSGFGLLSLEDDEVEIPKQTKKSSGFGLLALEDDDDEVIPKNDNSKPDMPEPFINGTEIKETAKGGKKSKKKDRKKKNEDEEDIDKLLEELALEMKEEQGVQISGFETAVKSEVKEEVVEPEKKKKNKKKKNLEEAEQSVVESKDSKNLEQKLPESGDTEQVEKKIEDLHIDDDSSKKEPSVEPDQQGTVKTAAQKKKEKKEREKLKKQAEFEQGKEKKKPKAAAKVQVEEESVVKEKPEIEEEEGKDEEEEDDKKKKKKKKKDEDEKKDKKRPGKKTIAAMQEALKKVKEEEERLRLEEEAKIKAEEEAEQRRLEKLKLEQERKEKKKLKEKEKRERLKAEGKILSKTQRQNKARMEATLAALREQGVAVPQIGEKKERAPRLGDRKRIPKKQVEEQKGGEMGEPKEDLAAKLETTVDEKNEISEEEEEETKEEEEEEEEEDVKDAWDVSTDEDESEVSSKKVDVDVKRQISQESESEESEDSEDEDESESEESSSESEGESKIKNEERIREQVLERISKRREEAERNRNPNKLRSPVVCVLGHVDTGKTKILDKIRRTHVQDSEAGGITQQIGATMVPKDALKEQCKMVKGFAELELKLPGLLIIDTPGHESFSNLRSRGSSLCDIAILVVDIMHGLEPQTIESINMLKQKKTPFVVALNKIDRLYEWKSFKNRDVQDVIKNQARNTKMEFESRAKDIILQFANQGLNAVLHYENTDQRSYISMVPTSALTGDGMGNLMALVVQLTQSMMVKRLAFSEELQATVLEVKAIPGLGTTIDAILVNGRLKEGDTIIFAGYEGPVVTQIRSLLMPQPLKELRVKNFYQEFKEVEGSQGVKIAAKDLDKAIAGLQLLVAHHPDEIPVLKDEVAKSFKEAMSAIKVADRGVYVQASTLGSLEALLEFLRASKIPYSGIRIGPVVKKDVMKASIMLEHDSQYAVILAFDVKIERDAQELADSLGVKIFQADIIYHLFDRFMEYRQELKNKKRDELKHLAIFPCKLRILPQYIFNSRDPIVVGVVVEAGVVKDGTPLCVPSKEFLDIGIVTTIEVNHKPIETARKGQEVCLKIEPIGGEAPKMYGRHFDHTDILCSKITRQSIDVCKEYFRDDLQKTDWQLMVELKKTFQIL